MKLDFDDRDPVSDFVSVPAGTYLCRVADVRERTTRNGDALWALRLIAAEGEFVGRDVAWDNLVFSTRGLNRVRKVFAALGLPADGRVDVAPADMMDKQAFVEVRPAEYHAPSGDLVRRNEVPYDGYRAVRPDSEHRADPGDDPIPF